MLPTATSLLKFFLNFCLTFQSKLKKSVKVTLEGSDDEEYILDEGDGETEDQDIAAIEEAVVDAEDDGGDDGQVAHDNAVVRSLHDIAIEEMGRKGVMMSSEEEKMALQLFSADIAAIEEAVVDAEDDGGDDGQVAHDNAVVRSLRDIAIEEMGRKGVMMSSEEEKMALQLFSAVAHDNAVVRSLRDIAIEEMGRKGVMMSSEEEKMALQLFPAVSGLARRVHDNTTLNEKFQHLIDQDPNQQYNKRALDSIVQSLTAVSENKLKAYHLSEKQWQLASDVQKVLKLFKDVTLLFSKAEVPLIVDALPMLYRVHDSLVAAVENKLQNIPTPDSNSDSHISDPSSLVQETPAVIRIAAHAAVLLIDKYMDLTWDCEIYVISIGMRSFLILSSTHS
ncbi:hypothetical protein CVT25_014284 [Psilocybe cyanescens]|uniref:Uncharacterized protein n=1 Tax=Psilocybe cyanescens TaxID=93625 RepID=A0A409XTG0_PSICY|nr:hypothetical protein CVT25_014284 [Psilocybe cyanescens]